VRPESCLSAVRLPLCGARGGGVCGEYAAAGVLPGGHTVGGRGSAVARLHAVDVTAGRAAEGARG